MISQKAFRYASRGARAFGVAHDGGVALERKNGGGVGWGEGAQAQAGGLEGGGWEGRHGGRLGGNGGVFKRERNAIG
jgi:hypothetical protein